jgi:hypothetical protein
MSIWQLGSRAAPSQFYVFSAAVRLLADLFGPANPFVIFCKPDDLIFLSPIWFDACHLFASTCHHLCQVRSMRLGDSCTKFKKYSENFARSMAANFIFQFQHFGTGLATITFVHCIHGI